MKKLIWMLPVLSGIFWGAIGVFIRKLSAVGMDNYTIIESRTIIAVLMLAVFIALYDKSLFVIRIKDTWIFLTASLLGMFGLNIFYNESVSRLSLSFAAVLLSLSPVFVLIIAAFLFRERITSRKIFCVILAVAGCVLVSGIFENLSDVTVSFLGVLIGIASAFFYAIYSIMTKIAVKRGYQGLTVTFYCLLIIALVLIPLCSWGKIGQFVASEPLQNSIFMAMHSLCTSVLPYALYTVSIQYMETGKASILAASEPVAAMVFGALFFSEQPTFLSLFGLALTVLALILLGIQKDPPS